MIEAKTVGGWIRLDPEHELTFEGDVLAGFNADDRCFLGRLWHLVR